MSSSKKQFDFSSSLISAALALIVASLYGINFYTTQLEFLSKTSESSMQKFESIYTDSMSNQIHKLKLGLDLVAENSDIRKFFIEQDREKLAKKALPLYTDILMRRHEIDRFNFWHAPAKMFLRLDELKNFGYDASGRRPIVVASTQTKTEKSGLEVGLRGIIALRVVAPILVDGDLSGAIEVGSDINTIFEKSRAVSGVEFILGVSEDLLKRVDRPINDKIDIKIGTNIYYSFSKPETASLFKALDIEAVTTQGLIRHKGKAAYIKHLELIDFSEKEKINLLAAIDLSQNVSELKNDAITRSLIIFIFVSGVLLLTLTRMRNLKTQWMESARIQREEILRLKSNHQTTKAALNAVMSCRNDFIYSTSNAFTEPLKKIKTIISEIDKNQLPENLAHSKEINSLIDRLMEVATCVRDVHAFRMQAIGTTWTPQSVATWANALQKQLETTVDVHHLQDSPTEATVHLKADATQTAETIARFLQSINSTGNSCSNAACTVHSPTHFELSFQLRAPSSTIDVPRLIEKLKQTPLSEDTMLTLGSEEIKIYKELLKLQHLGFEILISKTPSQQLLVKITSKKD